MREAKDDEHSQMKSGLFCNESTKQCSNAAATISSVVSEVACGKYQGPSAHSGYTNARELFSAREKHDGGFSTGLE